MQTQPRTQTVRRDAEFGLRAIGAQRAGQQRPGVAAPAARRLLQRASRARVDLEVVAARLRDPVQQCRIGLGKHLGQCRDDDIEFALRHRLQPAAVGGHQWIALRQALVEQPFDLGIGKVAVDESGAAPVGQVGQGAAAEELAVAAPLDDFRFGLGRDLAPAPALG